MMPGRTETGRVFYFSLLEKSFISCQCLPVLSVAVQEVNEPSQASFLSRLIPGKSFKWAILVAPPASSSFFFSYNWWAPFSPYIDTLLSPSINPFFLYVSISMYTKFNRVHTDFSDFHVESHGLF